MSNSVILRNGVEMPLLIQGMPLIMGLSNISRREFKALMDYSLQMGICGFDTSHDYGKSEEYIGYVVNNAIKNGSLKREDVFITSKIGNGQQYEGNIEKYVDESLRVMKIDYIDLMLLHWPTPMYYLENWCKLERIYQLGKVRSIGIANCLERHLIEMETVGVEIPHVAQFEYHPFRSVPTLVDYCQTKKIQIQAYTSLCQMIPLVTDNALLRELSIKYNCSIAQLLLCWVIQQKIAPVFRSYNKKNIYNNVSALNLVLDESDMKQILHLNIDYKYHPESLNCPGF